MIVVAVSAFPLALLAFLLLMERVERPLRVDGGGEQLATFLDTARAEEVDTFVSKGLSVALDDYRRRRRLSRLIPGRAPRA